jgi:Sulfotransferase family
VGSRFITWAAEAEIALRSAVQPGSLNQLGDFSFGHHLEQSRIAAKRLDGVASVAGCQLIPGDPVVIGGLPRTGTTLVQGLLGTVKGVRLLTPAEAVYPTAKWEAARVGKGSALGEAELAARLRQQALKDLSPEVYGMHRLDQFGFEECTPILASTNHCLQLGMMFPAPAYLAWLLGQPSGRAHFAWATSIGVLPLEANTTWVLKSPLHFLDYEGLFSAAPTARLVHVRRDVVATIASILTLIYETRRMFVDDVSRSVIVDEWLAFLFESMERASGHLKGRSATPIVLDYQQVTAEPFVTLESLVDDLGRASWCLDASLIAREEARLRYLHSRDWRPGLNEFGLSARSLRNLVDVTPGAELFVY